MAAPKESFRNYGHAPRAVLAVERNLREVSPGVYATSVELTEAGKYDLAFLLSSPKVVHCFEVAVESNPSIRKKKPAMAVEVLSKPADARAGETATLKFKVIDPDTAQARTDLADLRVLSFLAPGIHQRREWATRAGDGIYEAAIALPQPGVYFVFFECPSLNVQYKDLPFLTIRAIEAAAQSVAPANAGQGSIGQENGDTAAKQGGQGLE